jgi:hypothetical protein
VKILVPYLVGAASAFVVQFLIEIYVKPHVETRKRREERWEKDVLELGEVLSTTVADRALEAQRAQAMARATLGLSKTEYNERETLERVLAAELAWRAFNDVIHGRVDWIAERIIKFRIDSIGLRDFTIAKYRHDVSLLRMYAVDLLEISESDFDILWSGEIDDRSKMTSGVKVLAFLRHPPRRSVRRRIEMFRNGRINRRVDRDAARKASEQAGSGAASESKRAE